MLPPTLRYPRIVIEDEPEEEPVKS